MADDKQVKPYFEDVEVVAIATGFRKGHMVPAGTKFRFTGAKLPKWVRLADKPAAPAKAKPAGGDVKPKEAQTAAKAKAEDLNQLV